MVGVLLLVFSATLNLRKNTRQAEAEKIQRCKFLFFQAMKSLHIVNEVTSHSSKSIEFFEILLLYNLVKTG